ncbi:MAG: hypothetical protein HQM09_23990 [Candidatus Riflebacteria bacterium]|nr:hypothetical protein [Candidatus Riflebacteria bacterium]
MCGDCSEHLSLDFVGPGVDRYLNELIETLPYEDATFESKKRKTGELASNLNHSWQESTEFFSRISNDKDFLFLVFKNYKEIQLKWAEMEGRVAPSFEDCAEVAFCRLFEQYLLHGFDPSHLLNIETLLGQDTVSRYLENQRKAETGTVWKKIGYRETFVVREYWDAFISALRSDLGAVEARIETYIEKCTIGPGGGYPDATARSSNSLKENPVSTSSSLRSVDCEYCSEHFSSAYFAMSILINFYTSHELLAKLALARPGICDFYANSYWIARRAFIHCVQNQGVDFIIGHYRDIRLLLIAYAVLKRVFSQPDLSRLETLVQEVDTELSWQIGEADLLQFIDEVKL